MMHLMTAGIRRRRRGSWRSVALVPPALLLLGACGGADDPAASPSTVVPTTTSTTAGTTAPTTTETVSPSTLEPTTTTIVTTTTSEASTTTVETVPEPAAQPIDPPLDLYASEPVVELGSIAIPSIDVDMTLYEGIRMTTFDIGPGHWPGSAMPGAPGNVVVGGHRTSNHRVFRDVDRLVPGDEIVFTDTAGVQHVYAVREVTIVEPTDVWIIDPTDTPTATLFACHPPGSTAQRIVVFADLVA